MNEKDSNRIKKGYPFAHLDLFSILGRNSPEYLSQEEEVLNDYIKSLKEKGKNYFEDFLADFLDLLSSKYVGVQCGNFILLRQGEGQIYILA